MNYTPYGTDPIMDKLVDSPIIDERISAALDGYGLDVLVDDPVRDIRIYVVGKCNADFNILNKLVNDNDIQVRKAVALGCNGNPDILTQLLNDPHEHIRITALKRIEKDNPDLLNRLVHDSNADIRWTVINCCNGNPNILIQFVNDDNYVNRCILASRCNGNLDILNRLVNDANEEVRISVAQNCNGNPDILNILVYDNSEAVREAVARNCNGNLDILNTLVTDPAAGVRWAVAECCEGNANILNQLVNDDNYNVRQAANLVLRKGPNMNNSNIILKFDVDDNSYTISADNFSFNHVTSNGEDVICFDYDNLSVYKNGEPTDKFGYSWSAEPISADNILESAVSAYANDLPDFKFTYVAPQLNDIREYISNDTVCDDISAHYLSSRGNVLTVDIVSDTRIGYSCSWEEDVMMLNKADKSFVTDVPFFYEQALSKCVNEDAVQYASYTVKGSFSINNEDKKDKPAKNNHSDIER